MKIIPIVFVALLVAGCAGGLQGSGITDRIANKIAETENPEERAVRAGALAVIAAEVATDRVFRSSAEDAPEVWVFINQLERAVNMIRTGDGMWAHADLFDAKRLIVIAAGKQAKKRALSLLSSFGLRDALQSFAQGAKAVAMLRDVQNIIDSVQSKDMTFDEAWVGIERRIKRNKDRLAPLVGFTFDSVPMMTE